MLFVLFIRFFSRDWAWKQTTFHKGLSHRWGFNIHYFSYIGKRMTFIKKRYSLLDIPLICSPSQISCWYTSSIKSFKNATRSYIKVICYIIKCFALFSKLDCLFQRPFMRAIKQVQVLMFGLCKNFKIARIIIKSVTVNMMNYLITTKWTSQKLFHYKSMLKPLPSDPIYSNANKSIWCFLTREITNVAISRAFRHESLAES